MEKFAILDSPEGYLHESDQAITYLSSHNNSYWDMMVAYSLFDELRFFNDKLHVRRWGANLANGDATVITCMDWEPVCLESFSYYYLIVCPTHIKIISKVSDIIYYIVENTSYNMDILKRW